MPDAALRISNRDYLGWQSVSVTRSMEGLASRFDLELSEVWTNQGSQVPIPVVEGQACQVLLDGHITISGHVSSARIDYDATSHSVNAQGRSHTGDLVDCAAIYAAGKGQWLNVGLEQIARDLCAPFGVTVTREVDLGSPFAPNFRLHDGETVFEALKRAARMRHALIVTGPDGNLVITRAGTRKTRTVLGYGQPGVLKGGRSGSWDQRFSVYTIKTQLPGSNDAYGPVVAGPQAQSTDGGVTRYRPTIVHAEALGNATQLQERADWERNNRAGRSQRLHYTYNGWNCAEGLWRPNTVAHVLDPKLKVDADLLVVSVQQRKSAQGSFTELELAPRKAMAAEPYIPPTDIGGDYMGPQP